MKIDEGLVSALVDMGFNLEGCRKAVYHTKNQGLEAAMEWVLQHMGDDGKCGSCSLNHFPSFIYCFHA